MTKARTYVVGVGMTREAAPAQCATLGNSVVRRAIAKYRIRRSASQHNLGFGGVAVVTAYAHSDRFRTREIT